MGQPEGREPLNSRVQRTVSPLGWRLAADAAHLEPVQFRRPLHVCSGNLAGLTRAARSHLAHLCSATSVNREDFPRHPWSIFNEQNPPRHD